MRPIIDTHLHIWDLKKFKLPEIESYQQLNRDFTLDDFAIAASNLNIEKAAYMEVNLLQEQRYSEAEYITQVCNLDTNPLQAAFIGGYPLSYSFRDYVGLFKDNSIVKGVRQVLHTPEMRSGICLEREFVENIRYLGGLGLKFSVRMRPSELGDGVKLADLCEDTTLILDHCGSPDPGIVNGEIKPELPDPSGLQHDKDKWLSDIHELSLRKNVICKISGLMVLCPKDIRKAEYIAPTLNHCLDSFGPDRVVFGSNWPVCTLTSSYEEWVQTLLEVTSDRSEEDKKKLFYDNAARIYSL